MGICFGCCNGEHEISISSSSSSHGYDAYDELPPFLKSAPRQQRYSPPRPNPAAPPQPPKPELGPILNKPYVNIKDHYDIQKELGRGQFGITYRCVERSTGLPYACKSISRLKLRRNKDIDDVRREILILEHLSGQPNIVEFKGAYEDRNNLYLVMELCSGGELFDRIVSKKGYSEKEAAGLFRQIVNVVHVCHFMGVMHRDLKPENFLMVSQADDSPLKIIDFGLSVFIEQGKVYTQVVGSSYYIAPEVLQHRYGKEVDVWSAGIILYILLCGVPPFWAETDDGIFREIQSGKLDLQSDPWPKISAPAKDLIQRMLTRDPKKRITAANALEHPWLKEGGAATDLPIDSAVRSRMTHFRDMNKLKKLAVRVMAENLAAEEIKGLREMFDNIDTDKSGTISIEELRVGLARLGSRLHESELQELMDAADLDKNGTIDIDEFITATMNRHRLENDENLLRAFKFFDMDNSGYITRDELKQVMTKYGMGDEATIDEVLEDVDADKDGRIDYSEFVDMMRKGGVAKDEGFELLVHSDKSPSARQTKQEDLIETSPIHEQNKKSSRGNDVSQTQNLVVHSDKSPSGGQTKQEDLKETSPVHAHKKKPSWGNGISLTQNSVVHSHKSPMSGQTKQEDLKANSPIYEKKKPNQGNEINLTQNLVVHSDKSLSGGQTKQDDLKETSPTHVQKKPTRGNDISSTQNLVVHSDISTSSGQMKQEDLKETSSALAHKKKPSRGNDINSIQDLVVPRGKSTSSGHTKQDLKEIGPIHEKKKPNRGNDISPTQDSSSQSKSVGTT